MSVLYAVQYCTLNLCKVALGRLMKCGKHFDYVVSAILLRSHSPCLYIPSLFENISSMRSDNRIFSHKIFLAIQFLNINQNETFDLVPSVNIYFNLDYTDIYKSD